MHRITLIPGDGIGPEVASNVVRIIEASGVEIQWETHYAGAQALEKFGETLPQELLDSILRNKVALKGPVTTPIAEGFTSVNVGLRKALDLYSNLRPVRNLSGVSSRFTGVDLIIVRENTEDLYSGIEHEVVPHMAVLGSVGYINADFTGPVGSSNLYQAKFGARYAVAQNLSAGLEYDVGHRASAANLPNYTRHIIELRLRGTL